MFPFSFTVSLLLHPSKCKWGKPCFHGSKVGAQIIWRVELGCRIKANCPFVEPGTIRGSTLHGGLSKGSYIIFPRV